MPGAGQLRRQAQSSVGACKRAITEQAVEKKRTKKSTDSVSAFCLLKRSINFGIARVLWSPRNRSRPGGLPFAFRSVACI